MPLRVYLSHEGERHEYFIPDEATVGDIRNQVQSKFILGQDDGKSDKTVVVLSYMGAELKDDWSFKDIGVLPGATIRIGEKNERRPKLYVNCLFNNDKLRVMEEIEILKTTVSELRTIIAKLVGLPVGVFRLTTSSGQELFDMHTLDRYDIEIGDTLLLQTWDGWTDFLNLCMLGYTSHVLSNLSDDELIAKYQMKVAMHIACHFGHIDLALSLMKQGVRADDPVGYHPNRQWCNITPHVDSVKPPIHECAEQGQTALMRALVNYDITAITCKNAYDKTPFQVALMGKQKPTAGFLLGKQWSRIQYGPATLGITLPLNVYSKMKNWCERARDRNYILNGPLKSTLKRRPYISMGGTLVGIGVLVDGFTPSKMNGRSSPPTDGKSPRTFRILPSDRRLQSPKTYFKSICNPGRAKTKAKVSLPSRGPKSIMKAPDCIQEESSSVKLVNQDASLSRFEEAALEEYDYEKRMSTLRATNSRENLVESSTDQTQTSSENQSQNATTRHSTKKPSVPDVYSEAKLPELERKASKMSLNKDKSRDKDGQYIETGKDAKETKDETKDKDRSKSRSKSRSEEKKVLSAMKKAKAKTADNLIPLPLINTENSAKPYLLSCRSKENDPALSTLSLYEKYRGLKARDYAIQCLSTASHFKDKPWLQQVRLAMDLTSQEVRKNIRSKNLRLSTQSV